MSATTGGQAIPQCMFDHWEAVSGSPFEDGSKTTLIIAQARERKGLKPGLPPLENYIDKL